jgi:microcystin-dependent protein
MGLEAGTFIDDLDSSNPPSGDPKKQGDDHLRLIKSVLKNSIKRVSRAFYIPNTLAKAVDYGVLSSDDNRTIVCDTTAAFTLTLPTLVSTDAGWCIYVLKTTADANPVWIVPPSGTINGFTKIRRSVRSKITKVLWTGSVFEASRDGPPIGSVIEFYGTALPQGTLWPDGSTFTAADFVELNTVLGGNTKPNRKGRIAAGKTDMGGVDAGGITTAGSGVDGLTLKAVGGAQNITLDATKIPPLPVNIGAGQGSHHHSVTAETNAGAVQFTGGTGAQNPIQNTISTSEDTLPEMVGTANLGVTAAAVNNMPPTIIANFVLVAE